MLCTALGTATMRAMIVLTVPIVPFLLSCGSQNSATVTQLYHKACSSLEKYGIIALRLGNG